jgi:hypothetical protein
MRGDRVQTGALAGLVWERIYSGRDLVGRGNGVDVTSAPDDRDEGVVATRDAGHRCLGNPVPRLCAELSACSRRAMLANVSASPIWPTRTHPESYYAVSLPGRRVT